MPKQASKIKIAITFFTAILFTALFATFPPAPGEASTFPDISGHWAEKEIKSLAEQGIIGGYPDGNFYPDKNISRRELAKIVFTMFPAGAEPEKVKFDTTPDYPDIHNGWGQEHLQVAINYLPGFTDGYFRPDSQATRFEVAWLALAASLFQDGKYRIDNSKLVIELPLTSEEHWRQLVKFNEFKDLPERYRNSTAYLAHDPGKKEFYRYAGLFFTDLNPVALMAGAGILKGYGDGTIGLDREVTRAETAVIINRIKSALFSSAGQYVLEPAGAVYRPRTVSLNSSSAAARLAEVGGYYREKYDDPLLRAGMIYNLMLHTFKYDWDTREGLVNYTVADTAGLMAAGRGTDAGLAQYFVELARKAGLTAETVRGRAVNPGDSGPHIWAALEIGGQKVYADPTYGVCTGDIYFNNFDRWAGLGYQWVAE